MRLEFRILWIDDNEDLEIDRAYIENALGEEGFELNLDFRSETENTQKLVKLANLADLIVLDFKLKDRQSGSALIEEIREKKIFTDIVFYSGSGEDSLRQEVHSHKLDGVFCRDKDGIEQSLVEIIKSTIHKLLDLENTRGLIVSENAEIDLLLVEIIQKYSEKGGTEALFIFEKTREKTMNQNDLLSKKLERWQDHTNSEHFEGIIGTLDLAKRLMVAKAISDRLEQRTIASEINDFLNDPEKSIIIPRNLCAHAVAVLQEDGHLLSGLGKRLVLNDNESKKIRKNLISCKKILRSLLPYIIS